MANQFRDLAEEEQEVLREDFERPKRREVSRNFFTTLLTEGVVSKEAASESMPFIIFLAFLGMLYIGNRHYAENTIRRIDKLNKEVKELSWDFKTLKADLMLKSTQTEVSKKVDTIGLKEPVAPPIKIVVDKSELNIKE